ncbi:hypothetical protein CAPTEDRAFT_228250 [Capitella teleta]|uniref:C2H2-type domain-containing protein n=1 Tax=Capitella teleta TaxID=283909 RepID=R7TF72_CAPTE|nr:hypothetical protein CAPTEDRAFT_228250 [Capitella teleta]|eukprot:ELT92142.1 hypothetical protein CAPTEDRAFT_228250 [Capitella teleta]
MGAITLSNVTMVTLVTEVVVLASFNVESPLGLSYSPILITFGGFYYLWAMDVLATDPSTDEYASVFVKEDDGELTQVLVPTSFLSDADQDSLSGILGLLKASNAESEGREEAPAEVVSQDAKDEENLVQMFNLTHNAEERGENLRIEMTVNDPECQNYLQHIGFKFELNCQKCQYAANNYKEIVNHVQKCCLSFSLSENADNDKENEPAVEMSQSSESPGGLKCKWCPCTPFHNLLDLQFHLQCHNLSSDGFLSCCLCTDERLKSVHNTRNWAILKAHLHTKHEVDFQLKCEECEAIFPSHQALKNHAASHSMPCGRCKFKAKHQAMLDVHELCHAPEDPDIFCCFVCSHQLTINPSKWAAMESHLESEHPGLIPLAFYCERCGRGFDQAPQLAEHGATCIAQGVSYAGPTEHCCLCDANISIGKYAVHFKACLTKHSQEIIERFPINVSNKSTSNFNLRKRVNVFMCTEHEVFFDEEELFVRHMVQSHVAVPIRKPQLKKESKEKEDEDYQEASKCPHCYKCFQSEARLQKHMLNVHSGEKLKPVTCPICHKSFKSAIRLRNHTREVHEGKKRKPSAKPAKQDTVLHMCEACAYITPSRDRLKNHQKAVHEGVLPFKCNLCDYRTSERSDLARHKFKHKNEKRFACPHCSYRTNERWVLVNHCLRQHDVQLPKKSRDTRGRPGSLRWQQAMERRRQKQLQQQQQETSTLDVLPSEDGFIFQQVVMDGSDQVAFFVDGEAENASQVLLMKHDELSQ